MSEGHGVAVVWSYKPHVHTCQTCAVVPANAQGASVGAVATAMHVLQLQQCAGQMCTLTAGGDVGLPLQGRVCAPLRSDCDACAW